MGIFPNTLLRERNIICIQYIKVGVIEKNQSVMQSRIEKNLRL